MNELHAPLWIPSTERIRNSNFQKYFSFLKNHFNKNFNNYNELYNWSITEIEEFWKSIWEYSELIYSRSYSSVLDKRIIQNAKWFSDAKINFAENLLRFRNDNTAILSIRENYPKLRISYKHLYNLVARCANSLMQVGVTKGDRVAAYVSNFPEAVIGMLATTSLGAIWSSTSPDFGIEGVLDRFGQIEPKVMFVIEAYNYSGKHIECKDKIDQIVRSIPSIQKVILIREFDDLNNLSSDTKSNDKSSMYIYFNELLVNNSDSIDFIQTEFDHPVYIMYFSGTTGKPKCIVHGAGGTLIQHFKELHLHTDLKPDDKIMYYTTCGWMMWNWLVSSLMLGATVVLFDGNPVYPNPERMWNDIDSEKISIFGTSPKYITGIEKSGLIPKEVFNLSSLRTILSTGSPLSRENFKWVYENVKEDIQLSSISGGTDIISCFMLGCPIIPVYAGEIQCKGLGMKVEAFTEKGVSVIDEKAELVCTEPFPSAPIYFWNDNDNTKYTRAYFERFPGVWHHGDFIKITKQGGIIVYGRSDATLNPGGVRIGTAEIYRIVDQFDEILDSLVVGQNWQNDVRIVLFVVLKNALALENNLIEKIKSKIRISATSRHVPSIIKQVNQIPHTISGKKVEVAVTRILNGEKVDNLEAISNPESLEQFQKLYKTL